MNRNIAGLSLSTRVTGLKTSNIGPHAADVVILHGNAVERGFGDERLQVRTGSIITDRLHGCGIAVLDSHRTDSICSSLGKLEKIWIANGAVRGRIKFHKTSEGREALSMVAAGEINGLSVAYRIDSMEVFDGHNRRINPGDAARSAESDLIFEGTRWEIIELSLVRDDPDAPRNLQDRAYVSPIKPAIADAHARMLARQAIIIDHHQRKSSPRPRPQIITSIFGHRYA
jgi:hypothetical protein